MIRLKLPSAPATRIFPYTGWIFPMSESSFIPMIDLDFRSMYDFIHQNKGIYHENYVDNLQHEGDLIGQDLKLNIEPVPTSTAPDQVRINTAYGYVTVPYGFAGAGEVKGYQVTNSHGVPEYYWSICYLDDRGYWNIIEATCDSRFPDCVDIYQHWQLYYLTPGAAYLRTLHFSRWTCKYALQKVGFNLTVRPDYETMMALEGMLPMYPPGTVDTAATKSLTTYPVTNQVGLIDPAEIQRKLDVFIALTLSVQEFPLEDIDYGYLAMRAVENVNANSVNMLEFLSDLRHPTEMIPKLQKLADLKNLKKLADNYLTVDFGILPTISDIQSIIEAFKSRKAFLDRNGFKVYTSGKTQTNNESIFTFIVEQHIKLAIEDEDSEFQKLIEQVDSIGLLPTLSNVWDLLPYSFAIDWLVNVGNFLERIDTRLRVAWLNIRYATMSRKGTVSTKLTATRAFPIDGTIARVSYHRWTSDQCPLPGLSSQQSQPTYSHWLEAGALLIQRFLK